MITKGSMSSSMASRHDIIQDTFSLKNCSEKSNLFTRNGHPMVYDISDHGCNSRENELPIVPAVEYGHGVKGSFMDYSLHYIYNLDDSFKGAYARHTPSTCTPLDSAERLLDEDVMKIDGRFINGMSGGDNLETCNSNVPKDMSVTFCDRTNLNGILRTNHKGFLDTPTDTPRMQLETNNRRNGVSSTDCDDSRGDVARVSESCAVEKYYVRVPDFRNPGALVPNEDKRCSIFVEKRQSHEGVQEHVFARHDNGKSESVPSRCSIDGWSSLQARLAPLGHHVDLPRHLSTGSIDINRSRFLSGHNAYPSLRTQSTVDVECDRMPDLQIDYKVYGRVGQPVHNVAYDTPQTNYSTKKDHFPDNGYVPSIHTNTPLSNLPVDRKRLWFYGSVDQPRQVTGSTIPLCTVDSTVHLGEDICRSNSHGDLISIKEPQVSLGNMPVVKAAGRRKLQQMCGNGRKSAPPVIDFLSHPTQNVGCLSTSCDLTSPPGTEESLRLSNLDRSKVNSGASCNIATRAISQGDISVYRSPSQFCNRDHCCHDHLDSHSSKYSSTHNKLLWCKNDEFHQSANQIIKGWRTAGVKNCNNDVSNDVSCSAGSSLHSLRSERCRSSAKACCNSRQRLPYVTALDKPTVCLKKTVPVVNTSVSFPCTLPENSKKRKVLETPGRISFCPCMFCVVVR